ncbi:MAG TPA: insulinase family protein [Pirellulales bacterium]|jgi:predicted Zn-dependent peptidase|nr:insulinase family protein [Pirellulales bacterium]
MFNRDMRSFCWGTALIFCVAAPVSGQQNFALANGLRVRLVPEPDPGHVSLVLAVRAGILNEGKGEPHLAHVSEHATVYDLGDAGLAETVKQWFPQAKVNAETLGELMYFDVHCSRDELPTAIAIQASRLGKMNYAPATLDREIPRALSEVDHLSQQPGGMGKFALIPFVQAVLYSQTNVPLRRLTKKIVVEDVRGFHDRWFQVGSARLIVAGDFDAVQARKEIEDRFGPLERSKNPPPRRPALLAGTRRVEWDVPKRHWFVAWQIPRVTEADYPAVWLVGRLLQQRLFDAANRAGSPGQVQVNHDLDRMLVIGCEAPNEQGFEAARKVVMSEIERMSQPGGIDRAALRSCCDQLEGFQRTNLDQVRLPPGMTRTMARTNIELQRLIVELLTGDFEEFLTKLKAVSADSARSAVRKWLSADRACFVEVVPAGGE